jgi:hypothetical protein
MYQVGIQFCGDPIRPEGTDFWPIRFEVWAEPGESIVYGPVVPDGEIWLYRGAGIITDDGNSIEWMLQIRYPFPGHIPNPQLLTPIMRLNGNAMGTPTLALDREIILVKDESMAGRACAVSAGRQMGLRCSAWGFPDCMLPKLIGIL